MRRYVEGRGTTITVRIPRGTAHLSSLQVRHTGLRDCIARVLAENRLEPSALQLEVTEAALQTNPAAAVAALSALKAQGVRIVLDDFGEEGSTNVGRLEQLPIDAVKIDSSILRHVDQVQTSVVTTDVITSLGAKLGLQVIAEGVESAEDLASFRRSGCSQVQGYHVCRPVAANHFEAWYERWRVA